MSETQQVIEVEEMDEVSHSDTMMVELYKRRKEWKSKSRRSLLWAFFCFAELQDDHTEVLICCLCYKDKDLSPDNLSKLAQQKRGRGRFKYKSSSGTSSLQTHLTNHHKEVCWGSAPDPF
jgi:hypothetical protein